MLKEILIKNFAIIERLELSFSQGFNVFTGETGAGKSIILDAVSMLLGGKSDTSFVREGSERASVEGVFDSGPHKAEILEILNREDLLPDDETDEIVLSREIRSEGRSTTRVNGHSTSSAILQEIGSLLVDIHGQSEHLSLLKASSHISLVDRFAADQELLKKYRELFKHYNSVCRQLKDLRINEEEALRQQDMLSFQINEIEGAALSEDEESELLRERERLVNSESLSKLVQQALVTLEGNSDELPGVMDQLGVLNKSVEHLMRIDMSLQPSSDLIYSAIDQINEVLFNLQRYQESIEFNPRRLDEIEERVMLINSLKRKYGGSVSAVLSFARNATEKLALLTHADEQVDELSKEKARLLKDLSATAIQLSAKRAKAAREIAASVEKELEDLRMSKARFEVEIKHVPDAEGIADADGNRLSFTENGFDRIEFLIAPNPGEGLKPLVKIASGGETSRLMLALKNTLANVDTIPTMVFDEIDQGIGGRIGAVVGEKLWQLSRKHQVLCITHLPQLAAMYDVHFHVRKQITDERTCTTVDRLDTQQSIYEMAALLGSDSEENISAARAMLEEAAKSKSGS